MMAGKQYMIHKEMSTYTYVGTCDCVRQVLHKRQNIMIRVSSCGIRQTLVQILSPLSLAVCPLGRHLNSLCLSFLKYTMDIKSMLRIECKANTQ